MSDTKTKDVIAQVPPFDPIAHTGLVTITSGEYERMRVVYDNVMSHVPNYVDILPMSLRVAMTHAGLLPRVRREKREHVCGLQGFGAPGDYCPACEHGS